MGGEITKRTQFFRKKANESASVSKKTNPILSLRRGLFGHSERVLTTKARRGRGKLERVRSNRRRARSDAPYHARFIRVNPTRLR